MGTNTLTSRVDGNLIPASDHNELVQALLIDLVPRNNSRVPEDIIGSLGRSDLRWLRAFVKEYFIGAASNNLKIYEGAAGEVWIEKGSPSDSIRLKTNSIEIWVAGQMKTSFGLTTMTTINNYIAHNSLKTKQDKIGFSEGRGSAPGTVLSQLCPDINLNGCIAGKYLIFEVDIRETLFDPGFGTGDLVIRVNGVDIHAWYEELGTSTTEPYQKRFLHKWPVPSDGNYNIKLMGEELDQYVVSFRVEEV